MSMVATPTLSEEYFNALKVRANLVLGPNSINSLDARILPAILSINFVKDLAPLWSCSGHTREEFEEKNIYTTEEIDRKVNAKQAAHIALVERTRKYSLAKLVDDWLLHNYDQLSGKYRINVINYQLKTLGEFKSYHACDWYFVTRIEVVPTKFMEVYLDEMAGVLNDLCTYISVMY